MFNLFKPKLPIELSSKAWIEFRWRWLGEHVGWDLMRDTSTLTLEDFPELEDLTDESAHRIFERIASQFRISCSTVRIRLVSDNEMPKLPSGESLALGLYCLPEGSDPAATISISKLLLDEPPLLVATIAHELAHHLLLSGPDPLCGADEHDHEFLTDLVLVFAGFGLFVANCTVSEHFERDGDSFSYRISRQGYLSSLQAGYALGLQTWMRGDHSPAWLRQLRPDAREPCQKTIRYLAKTKDALVQPSVYSTKAERLRVPINISLLSPTQRLAQLLEWDDDGAPIESILVHLNRLLADPVSEIRIEALISLRDLHAPSNPDSVNDLVRCLSSSNSTESSLACAILLKNQYKETEELLSFSLYWFNDNRETLLARDTFCEVIKSLDAEQFLPKYQQAIVAKVDRDLRTGEQEAEDLLEVLQLVPDIEAILTDFFSHWSAERQQGLVDFRETGERPIQL